jgi:ribosomal protein S18 acetylase RimI-like enzyme
VTTARPTLPKPEIQLLPAEPQHVPELGRICYQGFKDIAESHGFPPDFPSAEFAGKVIGMLVARKDFYSVAALVNGRPVGSNFLSLSDPASGVGPITVDRSVQGRGIGRALMQDVIDYARRNNIQRVRLLQDAYNMRSLSLYTSLGFEVKEAAALMQSAPGKPDGSVRPVVEADLTAIDELSRRIYKTSRRNEAAAAVLGGSLTLLRECNGRIVGYYISGVFGHGVAETEEDALALIGGSARLLPPEAACFFCPLSQADLYRKALKAGCRAIKVMNIMALGPYEAPEKVWMPSVLY